MDLREPLPRVTLLIIAFVQGIALFALYRAFDAEVWPSKSPLWSYPLWTLAIAIPLLLLLSLQRGNERRVVVLTSVSATVLVLVAAYTGWQAEPYGEFPLSSLTFAYIASMTLASFKALMYLQQRAARDPLSYRVLFANSWRNFLVFGLSAVFAFMLWLVLMLWAALFNVIGIDFFRELFAQDWFVIPVLTIALGLAVVIFRDLTRIIDSITRLLNGLIKLLLPLIVGVAVIFVLALPFVGFDALWSTGSGTSLLLGLLAVMLFFTNAVYQDGRDSKPYSNFVHRLIFGGLCVMPVISILSLYGLVQRISQYGWTIERSWAFVIWALLTVIAVGYVVGIIRRRDAWPLALARVNTSMGLVVLAVMLAANSPILDLRKLSLNSQLARVESGEIEIREFDFWYTSRNLARPGYLAMEEMKREAGGSDSELLAMIENPIRAGFGRRVSTLADFWDAMAYRPEPFDVPQDVRNLIGQIFRYQNESPVLLRADLDEDGLDEYVLLRTNYASTFYYLEDSEWKTGIVRLNSQSIQNDSFVEGEIRIVEPRFKNLEIDGSLLQLSVTE